MTTTTRTRPSATPLVARLASQNGIDLAGLTGTGVGGRITAADVRSAAARRRPARPSATVGHQPPKDDGWFPEIVAAEQLSDAKLAAQGTHIPGRTSLPAHQAADQAADLGPESSYDPAAAGWFPGFGIPHIEA